MPYADLGVVLHATKECALGAEGKVAFDADSKPTGVELLIKLYATRAFEN